MLNEQAIKTISELEPYKRYQYFIKKIADFEELWLLIDENDDIVYSEIENELIVPFWSNEEFTDSCVNGAWRNCTPTKVTLEDLGVKVLSFLRQKKALVDVFPVDNKSGFVVSIEEFLRDLDEELKNYE